MKDMVPLMFRSVFSTNTVTVVSSKHGGYSVASDMLAHMQRRHLDRRLGMTWAGSRKSDSQLHGRARDKSQVTSI
jgi:hypothetical protein